MNMFSDEVDRIDNYDDCGHDLFGHDLFGEEMMFDIFIDSFAEEFS